MQGWRGLATATVVALGAVGARAAPPDPAVVAALPACRADQLSLGLDAEGGAFDGMQHGGTLLVLRNLGPAACRTPALPALRLEDARHRPLSPVRQVPPGMHPGPVVPPAGVAAGAELTASLRWVSGDAYGAGNCVSSALILVPVDGRVLRAPLAAHLCGPGGGPITFTQTPLRPDPTLDEAR